MDDTINALYETAKFYKEKKIAVHITLKSGGWLNGIIISIKSSEFGDRIVLKEERYGEMLVMMERIKEDGIVPREERR